MVSPGVLPVSSKPVRGFLSVVQDYKLLTRNQQADVSCMGLAAGTDEGVKRKHEGWERSYVKAAAEGILIHKERGNEPNLWCTGSAFEKDTARLSKVGVEYIGSQRGRRYPQTSLNRPYFYAISELVQFIPSNRPPFELSPFILVVAVTR